jgi:hypothetical protein
MAFAWWMWRREFMRSPGPSLRGAAMEEISHRGAAPAVEQPCQCAVRKPSP